MQSKFKLKFLCLLWLTLLQVKAQDIDSEFPEEFSTTTIATTTSITSEPATELPATTTTSGPTVEPITEATSTTIATTTEAEITTELPLTTPATTTTEAVPTTTPSPSYPTYTPPPIPTRPPVVPPFSTTTSNDISWDLSDESEEQRCYLREQEETSLLRWSCGISSWVKMKICYRCCYYGYGGFAGCNKLYSGPCRNLVHTSWNNYLMEKWELPATNY